MTTLSQCVEVLETLYPLRYAEQWDAPGLIVGDPQAQVSRIAFAADPTAAIIGQALDWGADLIVSHHPLLFRSVHEVNGFGAHGDVVRRLYERHCGLWVGHTNADAAHRGVGQAAADGFGLIDQRPLVPIDDSAADHPVGLGRVGRLAEPMSLKEFAQVVWRALPMHPAGGIRVAGDPDMPVRTVAVLPGSGDSLFAEATASGADVYVTSDLRHHPATDHMEQARRDAQLAELDHPRPALIDTPHSAIESMWFRYAPGDIADAIETRHGARVETHWFTDVTDPWDFALTPAGQSFPTS